MTQIINYLITTTLYLAVFYIFYQLLLSNDTHYSRNRLYLLGSLIFSLLLPLVRINIASDNALAGFHRNLTQVILIDQVNIIPSGAAKGAFDTAVILPYIYFSGLFISFILLVFNSARIIRMIYGEKDRNRRIIYTDSDSVPGFSAFGYIFLNKGLTPDEEDRITRHENSHIEYMHFADLAILKLVSVLLWFNPIVYLYERSIKAVHEYQADEMMLAGGEDISGYRQLIMNQLFNTSLFSLNNAFSGNSLIKKRMIMMTKKRSGKLAGLKMLPILPVTFLIFLGFSCQDKNSDMENQGEELYGIEEVMVTELDKAVPVKDMANDFDKAIPVKDMANDFDKAIPVKDYEEPLSEPVLISEDESIITVAEEMPTFQGGDINRFREWVYRNVTYPEAAKVNGIQGKVFVMFVVDEKGAVTEAQVLRGVDPSLDKETLRVIKSAPDWKPGIHKGEPVKVKMTIAVNYLLQ